VFRVSLTGLRILTIRQVGTGLVVAVLTACASMSAVNPELEAARSELLSTQADEDVFLLAGHELDDASDAFKEAQRAWLRHTGKPEVDRLAGIVVQRLLFARQTASERIRELRRQSSEAGAR
jgi:hypothetical protein